MAPAVENGSELDSQYSQSTNIAQFPQRDTGSTGLPAASAGLPRFDPEREKEYPSRQKRRLQPRIDPQLVLLVEKECDTERPKRITLEMVIEDGLRLWLQARAQSRLDSQTPTGFSSSSGLENSDLTTTTTTVDSQPRSVLLPGVASAVAELSNQPHSSRYSLEVNRAYAWESYRKDEGIKTPDLWAVSNYRTGKHDPLVDLWVERKRVEAEVAERRAAAAAAREQAEREQHERWLREKQVDDETRAGREAEELARQQARQAEQEATRRAEEEESRRKAAELDQKWEQGIAEGKKPWEIS